MMDRRDILLWGITKEMRGIEIAPYCDPLVPKREGYNSLIMDSVDTKALRARAALDPWLAKDTAADIEEVDVLGGPSEIEAVVRQAGHANLFDYIISSHNFQNVPDPVKFIQGCQALLKPDGFLVMAVPDKRSCFDYFRSLSLTSDFLEAYFEKRTRPTEAQIFLLNAYRAAAITANGQSETFGVGASPASIVPLEHLEHAYAFWKERRLSGDTTYVDARCWAFIPESCELILREIHFLGLTRMGVDFVQGPRFNEFFVRLKNAVPKPDPAEFYQRRGYLLRHCV